MSLHACIVSSLVQLHPAFWTLCPIAVGRFLQQLLTADGPWLPDSHVVTRPAVSVMLADSVNAAGFRHELYTVCLSPGSALVFLRDA